MKKSNLITLLSLILLIVAVVLFMCFGKAGKSEKETETGSTTESSTVSVPSETPSTDSPEKTTESTKPSESAATKPSTVSMNDALFIGDSRTVGLMEYAGIEGADFFCTVGMSVYNIDDKDVDVPNMGKISFEKLLESKSYGKIYIMLGINEIGYNFNRTISEYNKLIELIKSKQANAVIFVQANLHVTNSRSESDKVVNNGAINKLNTELSKMADGKTVFYLDANQIFDDADGGLSTDKSQDSTHLYGKYYKEWGEWIVSQTASLIG